MAVDLNRRINRDAIFVIKPVEQFFGGKRGIQQFVILNRVEQQTRFHPVIIFFNLNINAFGRIARLDGKR